MPSPDALDELEEKMGARNRGGTMQSMWEQLPSL